ncbi:hypothetical protein [Nostoc commune]|nr:hypothetical protein [Nostoc commune]
MNTGIPVDIYNINKQADTKINIILKIDISQDIMTFPQKPL